MGVDTLPSDRSSGGHEIGVRRAEAQACVSTLLDKSFQQPLPQAKDGWAKSCSFKRLISSSAAKTTLFASDVGKVQDGLFQQPV
jgi:hypothetical protein